VIRRTECQLQQAHKAARNYWIRADKPEEARSELKQDLENLINLQILNVSQNFQYLQNLPYSIGLLISLLELDVSYNKITTLPDSMGCMKKLQKLSVEGNPLVSPPAEVFEQGLHAVKGYLSEKMNGGHKSPPKKKSWVGKLVKYGTFSGYTLRGTSNGEREGFFISEYRSIDGLASPRHIGMFSPRRLFSPGRSVKKYVPRDDARAMPRERCVGMLYIQRKANGVFEFMHKFI
ncbi:hypothetical protein Goarm_001270, partial [Gossypium armourianum]|nr:hypothetical protein [Gossypium armourianum]